MSPADEVLMRRDVYQLLGQGLALLVPADGSCELVSPTVPAGAFSHLEHLQRADIPRSVFEWLRDACLLRQSTELRCEPFTGWRELGLPGDRGEIWRVKM